MINSTAEESLLRLDGLTWFGAVGSEIHIPGDFRRVVSWGEAMSTSDAIEWENACQGAANDLHDIFDQRNPADHEYEIWDDKSDYVRDWAEAIVRRNCEGVGSAKFSETAVVQLRLLVEKYVMSLEYFGEVAVKLTSDAIGLIELGYLPCGWEGSYPSGRLIVF